MRKNIPLAVFGIVAGFMLTDARPAAAQARCCVQFYDHQNADGNRDQIIDSFTKQINAMQLAIIEAMRLGTGQLTGNLREQSTARANMADVQDDRNVVGNIEKARLDAIREAASGASSCNVITSASGGTLGAKITQAVSAQSRDIKDFNLGRNGMPSAQGTDMGIKARIDLHCSKFASPMDVSSGLCQGGGNSQMADANQNISESLWYSEDGTTRTLSKERAEAARAYIINAVAPVPLGGLPENAARSQAGREAAAARMEAAARDSVPAAILSEQLARREGNYGGQSNGTGGNIENWAKETAKRVVGYSNTQFPNGVSWLDYFELRSKGFFFDTTQNVATQGSSAGQAIKDMGLAVQWMAYQNFEIWSQLEKTNATLATMLSIQQEQATGRSRVIR